MAKLLVIEKRGYTHRLLDLDKGKMIRAFQRNYSEIDFIPGTLFICEYEDDGHLKNFIVEEEILGDSEKKRIEICTDELSVGDLIDGVPILNIGKKYAKNGRKMAYAYFR